MLFSILSVHVGILAFFLFYRWVLKGKADPPLNRSFLLLLPFLAFLLPVLSHLMEQALPSASTMFTWRLPEIRIGGGGSDLTERDGLPYYMSLLYGLYFTGFLIRSALLFRDIRSIRSLQNRGWEETHHGMRFLRLPDPHAPFSFMGRVHLGRDTAPDPELVDAALEVFEGMPDWEPGMKDDQKVPVEVVVPVKFTL